MAKKIENYNCEIMKCSVCKGVWLAIFDQRTEIKPYKSYTKKVTPIPGGPNNNGFKLVLYYHFNFYTFMILWFYSRIEFVQSHDRSKYEKNYYNSLEENHMRYSFHAHPQLLRVIFQKKDIFLLFWAVMTMTLHKYYMKVNSWNHESVKTRIIIQNKFQPILSFCDYTFGSFYFCQLWLVSESLSRIISHTKFFRG